MENDKSFDNIIDIIKESSIYKSYLHILEQVKNNADIKNAVKDIKAIQKRIVNEKYRGNDVTLLETELDNVNKCLNSIPLYQDYIDTSLTLNELIKNITRRLEIYLNDLDI